jgi:hypothetical protein
MKLIGFHMLFAALLRTGFLHLPFVIFKISKHEDHVFWAVSGGKTEASTVGYF